MSFDQSQIQSVTWTRRYGDLYLKWTSGAKAGTTYQVYVNGKRLKSTTSLHATIPVPTELSRIDIGIVGAGEAQTDFSTSLPTAPSRRVTLTWQGGTYLDTTGHGDVVGFYVYASSSPAGYGSGGYGAGGYGTGYPTIPTVPTTIIPAYTAGIPTDGYGSGGYGSGGYGASAGSYSWTSDALSSGLWGFSVAAYDRSGNVGTASALYQAIAAPPLAPGASQAGSRLSYRLAGYGVGPYGGGGYGSQGYGADGYGGGVGYGMSQAILTWNAA